MTASASRAGQIAVVTGAARGIGEAVARRFLTEGCEVILVDADEQVREVADGLGEHARASVFDIADEAAWRALEAPRVDVLAHCAAILTPGSAVVDTSVEDFSRVLHVNLTGTFVANRAVVPTMQRVGGGRIVNMASIAGKDGTPQHAAYSASKGGVIAFTKSLAREVAASGITVNCIAPSGVETRMAANVTPEEKAMMIARIPLGRICQPEEVAALVSWIASAECSYTTGFCFDLSGGRATY